MASNRWYWTGTLSKKNSTGLNVNVQVAFNKHPLDTFTAVTKLWAYGSDEPRPETTTSTQQLQPARAQPQPDLELSFPLAHPSPWVQTMNKLN
ncbi:hypothetical protein ONZ45_g8615 [Pleurotus djamor]|nr:hypothetical protein ONZ45_g8615 [Pleurotus djamor]